jgi:hypothetical protein
VARRSKAKRLLLIGLIGVALVPVATLAIPNPLRALAPGLFGFVCEERVCVDDARRLAEAQELVRAARASLSEDPRRKLPADLEAWKAQYERRLGGERGAALWAKVQALYSTDEAEVQWKR